jgi:gamma-glutamyltranspeptidase/glutathione hydrolase
MNRLANRCLMLLAALLFALHAIAAPQAGVASAHPLATEAGLKILRSGGNAFDAAVAVSAALAVVEPYSSGIGGGGFWLLHVAAENRDVMLDGRERAPLAATPRMYLDADGNVIDGASVNGPLSAGIPGEPAALEHLARHYGRLPLSVTLKPAIELARDGFVSDAYYQRMAAFRQTQLNTSADAAHLFLRDAKAPPAGTRITQPELANTLQRIADSGAAGFYTGELAQRLVDGVREHGGIWSMRDLADYRVVERKPVSGEYRGMKIVSASPPSSGGVAILEMLNILSAYDLDELPQASRIHLQVEAMRRAYRDRAEYLGDTDFIDVPVGRLTSLAYARGLAKSIEPDRATDSAALKPVDAHEDASPDTTHFSIIDAEGNRVAATLSINYPFGSCFVAPGTGVLLNDEMDDFSAKPGEPNVYGLVGAQANAIEPGKRMLSSMSPTFLQSGDRVAVLGTPGGSRIITMVLLAALDFHNGASASHMVALGRFHHQYLPDKIFYEPGVFSEDVVRRLIDMGHEVEQLDGTYGNMQVLVQHTNTGKIDAASDARVVGSAAVTD